MKATLFPSGTTPLSANGLPPAGFNPTCASGTPVHPVIGPFALIYPGHTVNVSASKLGFGIV
ncbi:MAG: hypothetical protein QHJ82_09830 [Verrucomicrobiota bacterium]|nr:hypothetical protein [Verrucomicrobiota bacterium]